MSRFSSRDRSESHRTRSGTHASDPTGEGAGRWRGALRAAAGRARLRLRTTGIEAVARLTGWLLRALLGHAAGRIADLFRSASSRSRHREERLQRSTERLVGTLGALKGVFAKAGQFASLRHDVVSKRLRRSLARLQSRVPPLEFEAIRTLVETELKLPLDRAFRNFEPIPIGAASIAQVHRADLPDGSAVAVKVQYPWIRASLPADLALLRAALGLWEALGNRSGRAIDVDRLFGEIADGLAEELDFEREGRVAGEIAANLADDPQIVVPRIVQSHSSSRILTMHYHESVSIRDRCGLERLGVEPRAVVEILARAYAKQVFVDGLFHADPHPGNLFVIDEEGAAERPRVLFVDFGLSKRLSADLRRELRLGLYALLRRDPDDLLERMRRMGMVAPGAEPRVRQAAGEMLGRITAGTGPAGVLDASNAQILPLEEAAKRLLGETPGLQLPNDLLLYAKTLSYLFALGREIAPSVDLMKISLPYLLQFLARESPPSC